MLCPVGDLQAFLMQALGPEARHPQPFTGEDFEV